MYWKFFSVLLAATVKTFFAPAMGFSAGLSFGDNFVATAAGGIIGFLFFFYLFDWVMTTLNKKKKHPTLKKIKKARKVVTMMHKYPVWLFVLVLPLTSVPVMAVVIRRFFHYNKPVFALSLFAVTLFALAACVIFSPLQLA